MHFAYFPFHYVCRILIAEIHDFYIVYSVHDDVNN